MFLGTSAILTWSLAAGCLAVMVFLLAGMRSNPIEQRLGQLADTGAEWSPSAGTGSSVGVLDTASGPALPALESPLDRRTARRIRQQDEPLTLKERLVQAGLYSPGAAHVFFVVRVILMVTPAVLGFLASRVGQMTLTQGLVLGGVAGLAGTLAPVLWLDHVKRRRQTEIRRALPDALDVMVICLQGGLSLSGTLSRVARELAMAHPLLALELNIVERQIQMGRSIGDAIRELASRFDLEELRSMASVVVQTERIGSSIVAALEVFADTLRLRRYQRAEEMGHKASVKMLIPTLLFIFPAIFVVILGPAAIQIYQHIIHGMMRATGN